MPTNAGIEHGRPGLFQGLGQGHRFLPREAAFNQIKHGEAIEQNKIITTDFTGPAHHFDGKADAVFKAAAPIVLALIGPGRDELGDQIAFRAHDFDPVITGLPGLLGARGVVFDGLQDLVMFQGARHLGVDARGDG